MMLLPSYALMAQGTQIHVATWPWAAARRNDLLSQAFAAQGGCDVSEVGALRAVDDVPERFRERAPGQEAPKTRQGHAPGGDVLAEAPSGEDAIVTARVPRSRADGKARRDVGGHYARPEVLQLVVHGQLLERVIQPEPVGAAARATVRPVGVAASAPDNGQETDQLLTALQCDELTAV